MTFTLKPSSFDTVNAAATQLGEQLGLDRNTACGVMAHACRRLAMHAFMFERVRWDLGLEGADEETVIAAIIAGARRRSRAVMPLSITIDVTSVTACAGSAHALKSAQAWSMIREGAVEWMRGADSASRSDLAADFVPVIKPHMAKIRALGFTRIEITDHFANTSEIDLGDSP